ncbi:MAG: hypothetical protein FJ109_17675 [Deltaproteobacteria bacterium]|nr:hypothetical protein [Deltaproteobacteria bacterium]
MRLAIVSGALALILLFTTGLGCGRRSYEPPEFAPSVSGGNSNFQVRYGDVAVVIQAPPGFMIAQDGGTLRRTPAGYHVSSGETYSFGLFYGETQAYLTMRIYTTTDFTDTSKVVLPIDEDMIQKVLAGDSQILRVNDPQVKVTVLEARIGNRSPEGFYVDTEDDE